MRTKMDVPEACNFWPTDKLVLYHSYFDNNLVFTELLYFMYLSNLKYSHWYSIYSIQFFPCLACLTINVQIKPVPVPNLNSHLLPLATKLLLYTYLNKFYNKYFLLFNSITYEWSCSLLWLRLRPIFIFFRPTKASFHLLTENKVCLSVEA